METLYGYSLALVGEKGETCLIELSRSPKFLSSRKVITNHKLYSLQEICMFTYSVANPNSLDDNYSLMTHLKQTNGCIEPNFLCMVNSRNCRFAIINKDGLEISDTLLFPHDSLIGSGDSPNNFTMETPFSFFEGLVFKKLNNIRNRTSECQGDYDYLHGLIERILKILNEKNCTAPSPELRDRIKNASNFLSILESYNPTTYCPKGHEYHSSLPLFLKKIFSTERIVSDRSMIRADTLDWHLVLVVLSYDNEATPPEIKGARFREAWKNSNDKAMKRQYARRNRRQYGRPTQSGRNSSKDPNGNWRQ